MFQKQISGLAGWGIFLSQIALEIVAKNRLRERTLRRYKRQFEIV